MNFSEKLTALRRREGLSQEQLADRLGVTRQSVSKWEGGAALPELGKLVADNYVNEEEATEAAAEEGGADDRTAAEESEGEEADAISGATLADKWGYVAAILNSIG